MSHVVAILKLFFIFFVFVTSAKHIPSRNVSTAEGTYKCDHCERLTTTTVSLSDALWPLKKNTGKDFPSHIQEGKTPLKDEFTAPTYEDEAAKTPANNKSLHFFPPEEERLLKLAKGEHQKSENKIKNSTFVQKTSKSSTSTFKPKENHSLRNNLFFPRRSRSLVSSKNLNFASEIPQVTSTTKANTTVEGKTQAPVTNATDSVTQETSTVLMDSPAPNLGQTTHAEPTTKPAATATVAITQPGNAVVNETTSPEIKPTEAATTKPADSTTGNCQVSNDYGQVNQLLAELEQLTTDDEAVETLNRTLMVMDRFIGCIIEILLSELAATLGLPLSLNSKKLCWTGSSESKFYSALLKHFQPKLLFSGQDYKAEGLFESADIDLDDFWSL